MILQLQVTDLEHAASFASTAAHAEDAEIQTRRGDNNLYEALGRTETSASHSSESSAEPTNDSEGDADYTMSAGNSVSDSASSYVDSENDWMTEVLRLCSSLKARRSARNRNSCIQWLFEIEVCYDQEGRCVVLRHVLVISLSFGQVKTIQACTIYQRYCAALHMLHSHAAVAYKGIQVLCIGHGAACNLRRAATTGDICSKTSDRVLAMMQMTDINIGESDIIESEDIMDDVSGSEDGGDHEGIGSESSDSEEPELLEYNEELLTEAEQNQLKADLQTLVKYHEKEQAFGAHLNLDLLGGQGLARFA